MAPMDVIQKILELALWTPSGDNQQTWRFRIEGGTKFSVLAWDTRDHCVYDLDGRATQIALGALFENIRLAATQFGLIPVVRRNEARQIHRYSFEVDLRAESRLARDPLIEQIPLRTVQRRPMRTRRLTDSEKTRIQQAVGADHQINWFESLPVRLKVAQLLFKSAKLRLTLPEAYATHASVIEWRARFSREKVPDQAVGMDPISTRLMEFALVSWQRVRFANRFLGGTFLPRIQLDLLPGLACAAHFVLAANNPPQTVEDFMSAGAAWMRAWLTSSALGLYQQPEMTPLIFSRYARERVRFSAEADAFERADAIRAAFYELIGEKVAERAVVMARIGAGPAPLARSLRRSLSGMLLAEGEQPPY